MKDLHFPKAAEADICLILEGTYPFAGGGVTHWVSELIRFFPNYGFAIIFLGTSAEDYHGFHSPLFDNVVHLEAHYIFERSKPPPHNAPNIEPEVMQKIKTMHDKFKDYKTGHACIPELFDLMGDQSQINEVMFTRSKESWDMLLKSYSDSYSDQSFFDYFWGVRSLHRPFWELSKIVDNIPKVKVLHSASTGYAGFVGALLQNKYQLPYILTEHGIYAKERWIELMGSYFFKYIVQQNESLDSHKGLLDIWTNFFIVLSKFAYANANPVISLFEGYRQRQITDGARPETTRIISYGIDFNKFYYLDKNLNQNKPVIAFIGRIVPIKDVKTIIRAAALIISRIPNAEVWLVGTLEEDKEYAANCRNLVSMLNLEDKILFLGEKPVMDEIYPNIDLLIMASISEGSPFVILESFAVGIPVITTDVGGCRELIEGKNEEDRALGLAGRLVELADADSMANFATELLTSDILWKEAQQAAVQRVRKYYSMEKLVEIYGLIYQEAILNGRNRV